MKDLMILVVVVALIGMYVKVMATLDQVDHTCKRTEAFMEKLEKNLLGEP